MQEKVFKQKEIIFWEGSMGTCMYKVIDGTVSVIINYGTKDERKLTDLGEGRVFGEMAILETWPRSATVIADSEKVTLLEISQEELSDYFDQDPSQIKLILENLSHRLRDLTDDYTEVCKTISEMRATRGETASRKEGLLSRISKFLNVYNHLLGSRNALEAMERYEEIEQARESHGQMRENLRFKKGQVILRQGDAGDCMYYIGYGTVGIYTDYGTENELLLTELHENQFFGEMGLIEKLPRSATAVVLENDTVLTRLTEDGLDQMFEEKPAFILLTLQHISSRLRKLTKDYAKACRTVSKMHDEENGTGTLSEDDEMMINYYIALAQSQNNRWMFY